MCNIRNIHFSNRIWYPTEFPSLSALSAATLSATLIALIRLGCVQAILVVLPLPHSISWSSIIWATCVVLPQPKLKTAIN